MQEENESICERLLGMRPRMCRGEKWFTTWADAGLILEALILRGLLVNVYHCRVGVTCRIVGESDVTADTGPAAIRAAALAYLKTVKP